MSRLDFFKRKYDESTVLERAKKRAGANPLLHQALDVLYFDPEATNEAIAAVVHLAPEAVRLQLRPQALRLIEQERARNNVGVVSGSLVSAEPRDAPFIEAAPVSSIDEMEAQAISIVMKAHAGVTLDARIKKVIIFLFKTFAPLAVLCLTIPESVYVFTHIYRVLDHTLEVLTGLFAVLVDFGYLYLTVLLALNKDALFQRRRAALEVDTHERKAVRLQSVLWWIVALMDTVAQVVFLYGATKDSTFFDFRVVVVLVAVRILSLFITMFVVSFAGTELMTNVDAVANEQVERARKVERVLVALGEAREKQQDARHRLEQSIADQQLRREGERFLTELYADAREEARRQREASRQRRLDGSSNGNLH